MLNLLFPIVWFLKKSKQLSALSCRLAQWTGKSKYKIHPKHLIKTEEPNYIRIIRGSDIVLDLGCGNGLHSIKFTEYCKKIICIDYNKEQLNIGKNISRDQKIRNIYFYTINLESHLSFKTNYFDKILCLDVLEHLNNREQMLCEIYRILKPNGIVFLTVPNKNTSWKKIQRLAGINSFSDPDHKIEYSMPEIKSILTKVGFQIKKIDPIVLDTPWVGFIDLIGGFSLTLYSNLILWKKNKVKNNIIESIGFNLVLKKHD